MAVSSHWRHTSWTILTVLCICTAFACAEPPPTPPDLTKDSKVDRERTYNLGPTGLRGWIYTKAANFADSQQGRTTTASRQILVTHVGANSPAEGVFQVDDVILGVGAGLFTHDARQAIGAAITAAEKPESKGVLKLTRWRRGKTEQVQLRLRVMGAYSATAPYDCPKSQRILSEACNVLEKEPLREDLWGAVNGLALLATGNREYLPKVQAYTRAIAPQAQKIELKDGMVVWDWGYKNLFLCEYYQITRDPEVFPAITKYTTFLAKGQSMYGTFGHGIAMRTAAGELHGSIPPYGPVNAAGLVANISIVLGKRCGVTDPEIDPAIERASRFFGYFVDKGSIPYGEHMPWPNHENNGKNSMAALMFALQGNRPRESRYFTKMVTASFENREYGHTGQGFSYLWSGLGANVGGPAAAAAFFQEAAWHLDLVRRNDGSFTYDGGEQYGPGKTDDDTYYGDSSYYGLSPTACYVLTYSLPLKQLWITGKDAKPANELIQNDVAEAVASGHFYEQRQQKTPEELVEALGNWSPIVRGWAAEELATRGEAKAMVPALITLAEGPDAARRQGACEALGHIKSPEALPVLVRLLMHPDRWLRFKAAGALQNMGDKAKPVINDMLRAVVATAEPPLPIVWDDPVQLTHGELAKALFGGLLRGSIEGIDTKLLYPAIQAIARNADGMARAQLNHTLAEQLTVDDVEALAPDILAAIDAPAPADTMFGNEIRLAGLKALSKYHFKKGLRAGLKFAQTQSPHGSESRMGQIMKQLLRYGVHAKEILPELRDLAIRCRNELDFPEGPRQQKTAAVEAAIVAIEAATGEPELRSIQAQRTN